MRSATTKSKTGGINRPNLSSSRLTSTRFAVLKSYKLVKLMLRCDYRLDQASFLRSSTSSEVSRTRTRGKLMNQTRNKLRLTPWTSIWALSLHRTTNSQASFNASCKPMKSLRPNSTADRLWTRFETRSTQQSGAHSKKLSKDDPRLALKQMTMFAIATSKK